MRQQIEQLKALMDTSGFALSDPDVLQPAALFFDQAGEDIGQRLFVTQGSSGQELCLRPEFTLPIVKAHLAHSDQPAQVAYSYVGNVFRQRDDASEEFLQAGVELIGGNRLAREKQLIRFALDALAIFDVTHPRIRIGDVALFETLLAKADMPAPWRPRIRHRFGTRTEMSALLKRLGAKQSGAAPANIPKSRVKMRNWVEENMALNGLSPTHGRTADEITARMLEKQKLASSPVPEHTLQLLKAYLKIKGTPAKSVEKMRALFAQFNINMDKPLAAFEKQCAALTEAADGAPISFDAGFGRRLDYYSGLVFEISDKSLPLEPLVGGGRYDRLLTRLGATKTASAIGCSIWLDRLQRANLAQGKTS